MISHPFSSRVSMLAHFEQSLGAAFADKRLLTLALTHSSYINESAGSPLDCNERLEFLGDAVLGMAIAADLYARFPQHQEGALTSLRSDVVQGETLARVARRLEIGRHLLMGTGEARSGGRDRASNLAAALEAIVGAVFLDQGCEAAYAFCIRAMRDEIDAACTGARPQNAKSALQEYVQSRQFDAPSYRIIAATGKPHAPTFTAEALVDGAVMGTGSGRSKSLAEQEAAKAALAAMVECG